MVAPWIGLLHSHACCTSWLELRRAVRSFNSNRLTQSCADVLMLGQGCLLKSSGEHLICLLSRCSADRFTKVAQQHEAKEELQD